MARLRSRFCVWYLPAALASLAAGLFAAGFALALLGLLGSPLGSPPPAPEAPPIARRSGGRHILVLGDSLAKGTGDETGKGYAFRLLEFLKRRGPAQMTNLTVGGLESRDLLELVEGPNVRAIASSADLILLSVGGNDLSHVFGRSSGTPLQATSEISKARRELASNLRAILRRLRESNSTAPIYLLGLYDPFGEGPERLGASVILDWNNLLQTTALSYSSVSVVPTFDLFEKRPDRLAADRFHPNQKGYEAIAARFLQLLPENL